MNQHRHNSKNIFNLRMFGTFNPYERYTKNVVCNLCAKAVIGMPLKLKRDVLFSWVDIRDVAQAIKYLFEHEVSRHDYNIALSKPYKLSEIAGIIQDLSGLKQPVCFENEGLSNEYTCDTMYLNVNFPIVMYKIGESVENIYNSILNRKDNIQIGTIDERWK